MNNTSRYKSCIGTYLLIFLRFFETQLRAQINTNLSVHSNFLFKFIITNYFKIISTQLKTCKPFDQRRSEKFFKQSQTGRAALLTFNNTRRKERREEPRSDTKLGN